jgi:hypothetical protein
MLFGSTIRSKSAAETLTASAASRRVVPSRSGFVGYCRRLVVTNAWAEGGEEGEVRRAYRELEEGHTRGPLRRVLDIRHFPNGLQHMPGRRTIKAALLSAPLTPPNDAFPSGGHAPPLRRLGDRYAVPPRRESTVAGAASRAMPNTFCGVGDPAYDLRENDFSAGRCYPVGAKNSSAMLSGSRNDRTDP